MQVLYDLMVILVEKLLPLVQFSSRKMKLFYQGRKNDLKNLQQLINPGEDIIWIQAASLGEFEQAVPIIQSLKNNYPEHKILVSFYSPSGYEIKKNDPLIDYAIYLPIDTPRKARRFMEFVQPKLGVFIKYDIWPNFLREAKKHKVPLILVSGIFREEQIYFRPYGGFMRKALNCFQHIFVQGNQSKKLLEGHGYNNVSVSGDTRYDRVFEQLSRNNELDFTKKFIGGKTCLVCGSTWPEDENAIAKALNTMKPEFKIIIAPHEIKPQKIERLKSQLQFKTVCYSEKDKVGLGSFQVLILDTIGLLSKVYAQADIAYVGGAMGKTGLHNILEPAVFGVPIIIGTNFKKFPEAKALQKAGGLFAVNSSGELQDKLELFLKNEGLRQKTGETSAQFISDRKGATEKVMQYINSEIQGLETAGKTDKTQK